MVVYKLNLKENESNRNFEKDWTISAKKIKSSESLCKEPIQPIVELSSSLRHIIVTRECLFFALFCSKTFDMITNTLEGVPFSKK